MNYVGEHTFIGQLGEAFVILALTSALLAGVAYLMAFRLEKTPEENSWKKIGNWSFTVHTAAVLGIVSCIFIMLVGNYIEYDYIQKHSSKDMPFKYILVAFWGGQEGSLTLWAFCHVLVASVFRFTNRKSEYKIPVMAVISIVQVFVTAVLLGIEFGDYKLGVSPFHLLRMEDGLGELWASIPNYLEIDPNFKDGAGLTPALQNYWMIIHPPTLFTGFALTLIPFAFAIAGMWKKDYYGWIKPALPWTYFGVAILGTGILMGGAWAYESLNFGGFWAWDPVENASLVPWIFLVAGAHVMLISKNRKKSAYSSILLTAFSFIFVIYSSFLTRSGVLGDSSVHSFTGDGMTEEFVIMLASFTILILWSMLSSKNLRYILVFSSLAVLVLAAFTNISETKVIVFSLSMLILVAFLVLGNLYGIPRDNVEDSILSREFWMFIGALLLLVSAFHIALTTSLPAFGLVFDTEWKLYGDNVDRNQFYNKWQSLFAIFIVLLVAINQYFKWKKTDGQKFIKQIGVPFLLSLFIGIPIVIYYEFNATEVHLSILLIASIFAIFANLDYWLRILKGKMNHAGASIAHFGFAMLIVGAVISMAKQEVISRNTTHYMMQGIDKNLKENEDMLIFRGDTVEMNDFYVYYGNEYIEEEYIYYYDIEYFDKVKRRYGKGDTVRYKGVVYVANEDHEASDNFLADLEAKKWTFGGQHEDNAYFSFRKWNPTMPGAFQFRNNPRVLLDLKNFRSNFPEPGTRHYLSYDIFTHVRLAKLDKQKYLEVSGATDEINGYFQGFSLEGAIGDTMYIPGHMVILDSIYPLPPESKAKHELLANDVAIGARLKFREFKEESNRTYTLEIVKAFRDDIELPMVSKVAPLRMAFKLESIDFGKKEEEVEPGHEGHDHGPGEHGVSQDENEKENELAHNHEHDSTHIQELTPEDSAMIQTILSHPTMVDSIAQRVQTNPYLEARIKIDAMEEEYLIMKAIIFPWINLLWLGIVIMMIGTIMAVIYRVKSNNRGNGN
ncbi:MAG: cytochrome c biogenesis protein CcsA [Crocinitomicaceae bacterium]